MPIGMRGMINEDKPKVPINGNEMRAGGKIKISESHEMLVKSYR